MPPLIWLLLLGPLLLPCPGAGSQWVGKSSTVVETSRHIPQQLEQTRPSVRRAGEKLAALAQPMVDGTVQEGLESWDPGTDSVGKESGGMDMISGRGMGEEGSQRNPGHTSRDDSGEGDGLSNDVVHALVSGVQTVGEIVFKEIGVSTREEPAVTRVGTRVEQYNCVLSRLGAALRRMADEAQIRRDLENKGSSSRLEKCWGEVGTANSALKGLQEALDADSHSARTLKRISDSQEKQYERKKQQVAGLAAEEMQDVAVGRTANMLKRLEKLVTEKRASLEAQKNRIRGVRLRCNTIEWRARMAEKQFRSKEVVIRRARENIEHLATAALKLPPEVVAVLEDVPSHFLPVCAKGEGATDLSDETSWGEVGTNLNSSLVFALYQVRLTLHNKSTLFFHTAVEDNGRCEALANRQDAEQTRVQEGLSEVVVSLGALEAMERMVGRLLDELHMHDAAVAEAETALSRMANNVKLLTEEQRKAYAPGVERLEHMLAEAGLTRESHLLAMQMPQQELDKLRSDVIQQQSVDSERRVIVDDISRNAEACTKDMLEASKRAGVIANHLAVLENAVHQLENAVHQMWEVVGSETDSYSYVSKAESERGRETWL